MRIFSFLLLSFLIITAKTYADVQLHVLFSDDMILQREKPVPVWGTATPGEKVVVTIGKAHRSTQADTDGTWRVSLPSMPAAQGLTLTVQGNNRIELKNVAVGDVYLCSGQSNMEWSLNDVNNAKAEIAAANYPNIRLFTVPRKVAGAPQKEFASPTRWEVCTPPVAAHFSAVGYFFGRDLHQRLKLPIGLIDASWGGTIAQAWMSRDTLLKRDDLRESTLQTERSFVSLASNTYEEELKKFWQENDSGISRGWNTLTFDDYPWKTMLIPGTWETSVLPNFDGVVWLRKTIEIPAAWQGHDLTLRLGAIDDRDTTFFNGVPIGAMEVWNQPRVYKVPANLVTAGRATIAIRVLDTGGGGGIHGDGNIQIELSEDSTQNIPLGGDWKYQVAAALKDLPPVPMRQFGNPNQPTVLYNGMIAPLLPFPIRGVIWYQGESNANDPVQYRTLFPDLIRDWRTKWNAKQDGSEFGFFFVQLANYTPRVPQPVQPGWAELREAQTMALALPRTGMATAIDIGEANDIHPRNKQDVGKRLALAALAIEYGENIEYTGPMFHLMEMEVGSNRLRIHFTHSLGLRTGDGQAPRGFAIQSVDGNWHHATARIDGESVVVWSDEVLQPKAARYAWANNPDVNLVNGAGLPAVPFRTDKP